MCVPDGWACLAGGQATCESAIRPLSLYASHAVCQGCFSLSWWLGFFLCSSFPNRPFPVSAVYIKRTGSDDLDRAGFYCFSEANRTFYSFALTFNPDADEPEKPIENSCLKTRRFWVQRFPTRRERDSGERWPGPASDVGGDTLAEGRLLSRIHPQLDPERVDWNQSSSDLYGNAQEFPLTLLRLPAADSFAARLHAYLRYTLGN